MDRAYLDFGRIYTLHTLKAYFVTRAKKNFQFQRRYSHPVDRSTGIICDQTVVLTGFYPKQSYPETLRRVKYRDPDGRVLAFLTNDFSIPALLVADLYKGAGRSNCFSNGSSNTCESKPFSAPARTRSKHKFGQPSAFTYSWPSQRSG